MARAVEVSRWAQREGRRMARKYGEVGRWATRREREREQDELAHVQNARTGTDRSLAAYLYLNMRGKKRFP